MSKHTQYIDHNSLSFLCIWYVKSKLDASGSYPRRQALRYFIRTCRRGGSRLSGSGLKIGLGGGG